MTSSSFGAQRDVDEWILLGAARAGDERAFGLLVERHRGRLAVVCVLMLGDPEQAERAMNETVVTAWRERELATASSSTRIWLYRIALRVCQEHCDEL